ncbi:DUF1348 family protein [Streptomyces kasugaensis]|nr:DUF1348 family protein [Streptomyces kasugaensis]
MPKQILVTSGAQHALTLVLRLLSAPGDLIMVGNPPCPSALQAMRRVAFLREKWDRELGYALRKERWAFRGNRIAVRFPYECHDASGRWWRSYGNEWWEFTADGLMHRREASINDVPIAEADRRIFGSRPAAERGVALPLCDDLTPGGEWSGERRHAAQRPRRRTE